MAGIRLMQQVKNAIANLNPSEVKQSVEIPVRIRLYAPDPAAFAVMEAFLAGPQPTADQLGKAQAAVERANQPSQAAAQFRIDLYHDGLLVPSKGFAFDPRQPQVVVNEILERHEEWGLALASRFPPFREAVVAKIIKNIAKENALFSLATAVPGIVPFLSLPLSVGEFASDSAFLTMNQIRMAFLISAASGRGVGYSNQRNEIASIVASAFGWRAVARELVGKIPLGGGLIPKAGISYAATFVVGLALDKFYRLGVAFPEKERSAAYAAALEKGKEIAASLLANFRSRAKVAS